MTTTKVTPEHREALRAAIVGFDTEAARSSYRAGNYPRAESTKDVDKRYRWDLLWASGANRILWDANYSDAHIDTALRSIVSAL